MSKLFTANEVRRWANAYKGTGASAVLDSYADHLEADEKAVPLAWMVGNSESGPFDFRKHQPRGWPVSKPLYEHPAPSDAERLAEALRPFTKLLQKHHDKQPDDHPVFAINGEAFTFGDLRSAKQALAAHSAQAQPPAASVPDAMQELADKYHELLWAVARKFPGETRHETALRYIREAECQEAALAAQENPNG